MNGKKVLKIVLSIILILFIIFLVITIRRMIIIKDLSEKVSKYINNDNHYEKIVNNSESTETITEYYSKGDNAVMILNSKEKDTGKVRKLMQYYKGEKSNTYIEVEGSKIAVLDSNGVPSRILILRLDYDNNLWNLFQMAVVSNIKSVEYNEKDCYIVNSLIGKETYIEKETGLILKSNYGMEEDKYGNKSDIIIEYYYEFDNVDDNIFIEPDISQYKIQENN